MRPAVFGAALSVLVGGLATAEPLAWEEVSEAVGLTFHGEVGDPFPAITEDSALQLMFRNMGNGVAVGDIDADGDLDVYLLAQLGRPNVLFRNLLREVGVATFVEETPAILADLGMSRSAHFADLDGDGDEDLVLLNDDAGTEQDLPSRLLRNDGEGTWTDVTEAAGFRPVGYLVGGSTLGDVDRDGDLDIYVTYWTAHGAARSGAFIGSNQLWRNVGGLRFEDATVESGLGGLSRDSFTPLAADLDEDGRIDLFVAVDHSSDETYLAAEGGFVRSTEVVGTTHVGNDMGATFADFDGDLRPEIYTTNITDPLEGYGTSQGNAMYVDSASEALPHYVDQAVARGADDTAWGWGVEAIDAEGDGDLDLVVATGFEEWIESRDGSSHPLVGTPVYLLRNDGKGQFERVEDPVFRESVDSRALVGFDYDGDGDQDVLTTGVDEPVRLYRSGAAGSTWLTVALAPDAAAYGSRVVVRVGTRSFRREALSGRSYLVGVPPEVHFLLPDVDVVDEVEVRWADGRVESILDVSTGRRIAVERKLFGDGFESGDVSGWVGGARSGHAGPES